MSEFSSSFGGSDAARALHDDSIVIDGLVIAKWQRELFEDMRKGGLTAANCTVSVWEGFQATVNNIVKSNQLIAESSDLVCVARTAADIRAAKAAGKIDLNLITHTCHKEISWRFCVFTLVAPGCVVKGPPVKAVRDYIVFLCPERQVNVGRLGIVPPRGHQPTD